MCLKMKISHWIIWIGILAYLYFINSAIAENIDDLKKSGITAFQNGHFIDAIKDWEQIIQSDDPSVQAVEKNSALIDQAEALQRLGHYCQARKKLQQAQEGLEKQGQTDSKDYIRVLANLGHLCTHYSQSTCELKPNLSPNKSNENQCNMETAFSSLEEGLEKVEAMKNADLLKFLLHLHRGNWFALRAKQLQMIEFWKEGLEINEYQEKMLEDYQKAIEYAKEMSRFSLAIKVANNAVINFLDLAKNRRYIDDEMRNRERAKEYLNLIIKDLLPKMISQNGKKMQVSSFEQVYVLLTVGQLIIANQDLFQEELYPLSHLYSLFKQAESIAQKTADNRAKSLANGYLSRLYGSEKRYPEALQLIQKAIFFAQQVSHSEQLLFEWYRYKGELLKTQQQFEAAVKAYRQAILSLEEVRSDIEAFDQDRKTHFKQVIRPAYLELVDLLLKQAEPVADKEKKSCKRILPSLNSCQKEKPQHAGFPNVCEFPIPAKTDQQSCYLINALAILERFKNFELRNYYQDECVTQAQTCTLFTQLLSKDTAIVYHILFPDRPVAILYFSDDKIQLVDLSYDDYNLQQIEKKVGLLLKFINTERLLDRNARFFYQNIFEKIEQELKNRDIKTLVFVPDEYLRSIPMAILRDGNGKYLLEKYAISVTPSLVLTHSQEITQKNMKLLLGGLSKRHPQYKELPELIFVENEVDSITALFPKTKILLNEKYRWETMLQELKRADSPYYSGIHISSHAIFGEHKEKTVILTSNSTLSMDDLERLVKFNTQRQQPIELLTLSACETAKDEKDAALGLAGVAVKTGVSSALATLWKVNDQSTAKLIEQFYKFYKQGDSKAKALQKAQLALLRGEVTGEGKEGETITFESPYYWGPFILIGNWQ
jgi:CHAT domain-containing protein